MILLFLKYYELQGNYTKNNYCDIIAILKTDKTHLIYSFI